jgi:hypothetical protein
VRIDALLLSGATPWTTVLVSGAVGVIGAVVGAIASYWTARRRDDAGRRYEALSDVMSKLRGVAISIETAIDPPPRKEDDRRPMEDGRHLLGEARWKCAGIDLLFPDDDAVADDAVAGTRALCAAISAGRDWRFSRRDFGVRTRGASSLRMLTAPLRAG